MAFSWTIGATDFTNVNGLKRKTYGVGDYNLSTTHQPTSESASTYVELTLPYAVVATGIKPCEGQMGQQVQVQHTNLGM